MATVTTMSPRDVQATFTYVDLSNPTWADPISFPSDEEQRKNIKDLPGNQKPVVSREFVVKDVSAEIDKFTLETHGFQYVKHQTKVSKAEFADDERVKAVLYPEVIDLVKKLTGASYVYCYDHQTRGPVKPNANKEIPTENPVHFVHCDQSYDGAKIIALSRIPDKSFAEKVVQGRFAIMNVWRPVKTIYKDPFACADATSVVDETDLAPMPIQADERVEEAWAVGPNENHRWYFKYAQQPDEVLIFKNFDSHGPVRRIVHSAFIDPEHAQGYDRESIEMRCIVSYDQTPPKEDA
ncbi:Catalyzes late reaction in the cephamycin biosynthetic pathway [Colletotrichum higginsianum IMI 349063]|uniref:Catalyzes late reaction in the cephamycin biosynthetic pathway n=1 Tax=Colletotrichum higginsianum (strain IMI 349063) TaxID=759273 RepID=A0A1B7XXU1_COLHI|nr:Catalyzes late reaction in the cephamycin biosynthetic pathway [Colletotrichum higginsianum IMI 349063]OBR04593.1 Catalyzes late reaction in the cephamycin biosynthetic pathway [Colletotrichum higginsianum IMI 349063]